MAGEYLAAMNLIKPHQTCQDRRSVFAGHSGPSQPVYGPLGPPEALTTLFWDVVAAASALKPGYWKDAEFIGQRGRKPHVSGSTNDPAVAISPGSMLPWL
jgi:hypothetical protein